VLCAHVRTLSYVHKQLLSVVRTSAWFFVCFNIWRLTCIAFLPIALHCGGILYYIYNIICISYNVPFNFILIHFAFNRWWSRVFHPGNLVLRFPVSWIPPMRFGPVFSSPVFSTPAIWSHVFQSRVFSIPVVDIRVRKIFNLPTTHWQQLLCLHLSYRWVWRHCVLGCLSVCVCTCYIHAYSCKLGGTDRPACHCL